jgi:hypothetical protein
MNTDEILINSCVCVDVRACASIGNGSLAPNLHHALRTGLTTISITVTQVETGDLPQVWIKVELTSIKNCLYILTEVTALKSVVGNYRLFI